MSWHICLEIDTGGKTPAEVADCGNMTWNVSPMYYEAFDKTENGLRVIDGMIAKNALILLTNAILSMTNNPEKYQAMNPTNKWGDYESALKYLETIRDACADNPKATVMVV